WTKVFSHDWFSYKKGFNSLVIYVCEALVRSRHRIVDCLSTQLSLCSCIQWNHIRCTGGRVRANHGVKATAFLHQLVGQATLRHARGDDFACTPSDEA